MNSPQPACPECEMLASVSDESNKIGEFLNWMASSAGLVIAEWTENDDPDTQSMFPELLLPSQYRGDSGINKLLAKFYQIDLDKVEQERQALLNWLRDVQK